MKYIFRLVNLIVLCIILQGLYFLALVYTLANLSPQVHFAMTALGIICVLFIISGRDAAVYKLLWSVIILLFPAVMGVAYLFYNRRKTGRKVESAFLEARKNSLGFTDKSTRLLPDSTNNERLARYIEKTTGASCASYSDAAYFPQGEDFHKRFLEELKAAKKYIFIEFFIIEQGKMWSEIFEVLKRKQSEGVEIRIVYDGLATLYTLPRGYYKTLRSEGFKCIVYNPLRRLISFRLNTRNHRKIAVIDGTAAFCGGLNLADAYINEKQSKSGKRPKTGHWKDSAVMVKGGAAWNFTLSFFAMWEFISGKRDDITQYTPAPARLKTPETENLASVWHDVPLDCEAVSERVFLNFINRADDYLYIITPYLSPSEELMTALCTAAKAGTDVRLMLPFLPDKLIVAAIAKSNYLPLLEAGVRIFEYPPGFIHSKNIVADDERAAVSTVNFDYRALYMHHECGVCFYGKDIIEDIKRDFTDTQKHAYEITLDAHNKAGFLRRGFRRACRIFEPLT